MPKLYPLLAFLFMSIIGFSQAVTALESDRNQPVHLAADSADINEKQGIHIYAGNVSVTQGSMQITAEEVTMQFENKDITTFIATGSALVPAYLKQSLDSQDKNGDNQLIETWGQTITYAATAEQITLTGAARLLQNDNEFLGDSITYSIQDESIIAKATPNTTNRVQLTIFPNDE